MPGYNWGRRTNQNNLNINRTNSVLSIANGNTANCLNNALNTISNQDFTNTNLNTMNGQNNILSSVNDNLNCDNNNTLSEQNSVNTSTDFNCFLQKYIGRKCSCEFIVGDNLVKRTGILSEVGDSFLVLTSLNNGSNILFCNTSNLIFVKVE